MPQAGGVEVGIFEESFVHKLDHKKPQHTSDCHGNKIQSPAGCLGRDKAGKMTKACTGFRERRQILADVRALIRGAIGLSDM